MNSTNKKHSILFRGLILVVAFALSILCFPINGLVALAADATLGETAYWYMTIKEIEERNTTVVNKGATYYIRDAYIGGKTNWEVGKNSLDGKSMGEATLVSSEVKVTYNGEKVVSSKDTKVVDDETVSAYDKAFTAEKEGTYVVTYSYKYEINGEQYTNSYDLQVQSVISSASISFENNTQIVMPSVIDLSVSGAKDANGNYKNLQIALPEVKDENGDVIKEEKNDAGEVVKGGVKYVTSTSEVGKGDYVVITANGGAKVEDVEVEGAGTNFYISGDYFKGGDGFTDYGAGTYTVKYSYYADGHFVTSTTKTTQVYAENEKKEDNYYQNYKLSLELANEWVDNGQTGVERTLPAAIGVTTAETTPASEKVEVAYKVEVRFTSNKSENGYQALSAEQIAKYNAEEEIFVKDAGSETYYLADPSKFKPLEDGSYTFIYTITDFYGNSVSSSVGAYEWLNIKDETKPTPIIYDAAVKDDKGNATYENADYKLASQTAANGVVVYAITMEDNVDAEGTLSRKIMTDETVVKMTISGYNAYNLVFNYRQTETEVGEAGQGSAWLNLRTNDFYINKLADKYEAANNTTIASDKDMLDLLKANDYLVVVDNANADHIYNLFKSANIFDSSITNGETLVKWLKGQEEEKIAALGFAYMDVDQTFGARTADNGMGTDYYYIHYIAVDAAGNETDISKRMQIGVDSDNELPKIKFSTTLQTAYVPNTVVKFDVPTATDTQDSSMLVKTMYRYLDDNGVLTVEGKSTNNLVELREDLGTDEETGKMENGELLTKTYQEYLNGDAAGYIDLTDRDASSYSIDLSEAPTATKLQIVVYTYDDYGNPNIYAQTVDIAYANDKYAPQIVSGNGETTVYEQGAKIELPTMVVRDDVVAYTSFDVEVNYIAGDGTTSRVDVDGKYAEREILSLSGMGEIKVHGGTFVAGAAGTYQAKISVKDSAGRTIVKFINYTVKSRMIIQQPQISASLPKTQTLELDDFDVDGTIEIPAPTVAYDIPRSVTYDVYKAGTNTQGTGVYQTTTSDEYKNTDFVVYGVDKNGKPLNPTTNLGLAGYLKPRDLGTGDHQLYYTVDLIVYNYKTFEYKEMDWDEDAGKYTDGGLYFVNGNKSVRITVDGEHIVATSGSIKYVLTLNEDGEVEVTGEDGNDAVLTSTVLDGVDLKSWFSDVKMYSLKSETYNVKIQDTKGPAIVEFDYDTAISKAKLAQLVADKNAVAIYGIQATDASNIDYSKSSISLSWKLASGVSDSKTWTGTGANGAFVDRGYDVFPSTNVDGTYTLTYRVYDMAGNYSTKEYTIAVGDNIAPTMTIVDNFVGETYEIGTELKIDLSSITVKDNNELPEGTIPTVVLRNTSTNEEIKVKDSPSELIKCYDLNTAGTYTLTLTVEDAVGNKATRDFTFEVSAKSQDTTTVYKVVGTVLIVVSVLVLAGVIVYFIVSKVKLDKELKK